MTDRLRILLVMTSCFFLLVGCQNDEKSLEKIAQLETEISDKNTEIENLKNENQQLANKLNVFTEPGVKYEQAQQAINNKEYDLAIKLLTDFINEYPCSKFITEAKSQIPIVLEKQQEEKKREQERLRIIAQGFDKLTTYISIRTDNTQLDVKKSGKAEKWIFDRNGYEYYYQDADKGSDFIVIDFNITSKHSDPKLPALYTGEISPEGKIKSIKLLNIAFHSWSDYGAYLGNHHDSKNDFAKKNTISFTAGIQMVKSDKKYIIFTNKKECYSRSDGMNRPPVAYLGYQCPQITQELGLEDFVDGYQAIKIFK